MPPLQIAGAFKTITVCSYLSYEGMCCVTDFHFLMTDKNTVSQMDAKRAKFSVPFEQTALKG